MTTPRLAIDVRSGPVLPLARCRYRFPDVAKLPLGAAGPVAIGGDFAPETIVAAYRAGIFPWPHPEQEYAWFSPHPRAVIPAAGLHVSRRLARVLRQGRFRITVDRAFEAVMTACAVRPDEGTWITPALIDGYAHLNALGWAHSIEVWAADGTLAGGLYGVRVGSMFGAESMFHRVTDASKVAMVAMMQWAADQGIALLDVQVLNPHTASMGAVEISRQEYLRRLATAIEFS